MKLKTGSSRLKTVRTADACMLSRMHTVIRLRRVQRSQLQVFALIGSTITSFYLAMLRRARLCDSSKSSVRLSVCDVDV